MPRGALRNFVFVRFVLLSAAGAIAPAAFFVNYSLHLVKNIALVSTDLGDLYSSVALIRLAIKDRVRKIGEPLGGACRRGVRIIRRSEADRGDLAVLRIIVHLACRKVYGKSESSEARAESRNRRARSTAYMDVARGINDEYLLVIIARLRVAKSEAVDQGSFARNGSHLHNEGHRSLTLKLLVELIKGSEGCTVGRFGEKIIARRILDRGELTLGIIA